MKTKPLVVLCWVLVAAAAALLVFNFVNMLTRPAPGFEYERKSGSVVTVVRGGPAERAGIRADDKILTIDGHEVGPEVYPYFFARAGEPVPIVLERDGARQTVQLVPVTQEELRRGHLRAGGVRAASAITSYLNFPLHLWILGLGAALLVLRPNDKDARLAAIALVAWTGSTFLFRGYGSGALLAALPEPLPFALVVIDAIFAGAFFGACVHFALTFPNERRGAWEWMPYVVAAPISIETLVNGLARLRGDVRPVPMPIGDAYSSIGTLMLAATLVILVVRFLRVEDLNVRRRLQLIFFSLLPGALSFIGSYVVMALQIGYDWNVFMRMLQTPATMISSGVFTYAVLRHRIFNIRVLLRRSLQYALAKSTLIGVMLLPLIGLVAFLYVNRGESLASVLTGTPAVYILIILPLVLVIRYRKRLLEALDRRFFREQYDARRLLLHVVSIIRGGSDMLALSRAALDEIDRALHPKHIALWQLDPDGGALHRGFAIGGGDAMEVDPLAASGTLATLLSAEDEPLDVHSRYTRAMLRRLPEAEREWLARAGAHLVVPLLIERRLAGVMVLGERKSEEPYSREDRELLRMLGAQLALTLDYTRLKQSPSLVWSAGTPPPIHLYMTDALQLCPGCGRCYAADQRQCDADAVALVPESGVPRTIEEKYVITRLLGRGGMGSVYLATQKRLNRPVAIKVLLSHLVGSSSMRTRFEREARIVARLRHPAIVTIHDFGLLPSGHAYLVMEYLDGDTLRKTIDRGPLPLEDALQILRPVADAVDAAHRAGVVHRDLKPENIMIVREPHAPIAPRVLDFGLAKMTGPIGEDEQTLVQSGQSAGVVGTLMYMAPEVLSGHIADARADQYSLALIAWELLAGEHPLGLATDLASVVRGHTDKPLIPIRERVSAIPPTVSEAIDRALAKKADLRFESVREFVGALRAPN